MSVLDDKITRFKSDVDIAHAIIHGDATTTVTTDAGTVDSFAKVIADNKRKVDDALDLQVKYVSKNPKTGQYNSVAAALASITNSSATNPYLISVYPGVYVEPVLRMKEYVVIRGSGEDATVIKPADLTVHFVYGANNSGIVDASVYGPTTLGQATFNMDEPQGLTNQVFRVERVLLAAADTLVLVNSGHVALTNCTMGEKSTFRRGFIAQDKGTLDARISMRNVNSNGMTAPFPETLHQADGLHSQVLMISVSARSSTNIATGSGVGVGIHLRNGGRYRAIGASLIGFAKGIWTENAGAAPVLECIGVNLMGNVQDVVVDHPGTTGSLQCSATRKNVYINPAVTGLSLFYTDQGGQGLVSIGPFYAGKTHATSSDIQPIMSRGTPLGVLEGGTLTALGGLQFKVGAGVGYVRVDGWLHKVEWPDTMLSVPAKSISYVYVNENSVISIAASFPENIKTVTLGRLIANDTTIMLMGSIGSSNIETYHSNLDKLLRLAFGPIYIYGSKITENVTTPRAIDVTAGYYFYSTLERKPSAKVAPLLYCVRNSNTGLVTDKLSQLDNTQYLNGLVFAPLTAGYFAKYVIYTNGDAADAAFLVGYPTAQYATQQAARDAPNQLPPISPEGAPLIATIIVQQGKANIVEVIDTRPKLGSSGMGSTSSAVNHGDLFGLTNDDHKQYMRSDGTRAMGGSLDMNNNTIENVKSIGGVDYGAHAARHLPNGLDPLATGIAAGLSRISQNTVGVANSFSHSDHTHEITGFQPLALNLTGLAAVGGIGIARRNSDGTWAVSAPVAADIPLLDWSKISTGKPTTLAGYGITDVVGTVTNVLQEYTGVVTGGSGTTVIAAGTTVPVATAGTQVWTRTVTPRSVDSDFMIDCSTYGDHSYSGQFLTMALFRQIGTAAAVCIGVQPNWLETSGELIPISIFVADSPATTQPVTYSLRMGRSGNTGTWYVGRGVNVTFGGASKINYSITEYKP